MEGRRERRRERREGGREQARHPEDWTRLIEQEQAGHFLDATQYFG